VVSGKAMVVGTMGEEGGFYFILFVDKLMKL